MSGEGPVCADSIEMAGGGGMNEEGPVVCDSGMKGGSEELCFITLYDAHGARRGDCGSGKGVV